MSATPVLDHVCPGCAENAWTHQPLAAQLTAWTCRHCLGILLSLEEYRDWKAHHAEAPVAPVPPSLLSENGPLVRLCGACGRIMSRYRTGAKPDFHVDVCIGCQTLWLDAGEWPRLVAANLHRELDVILREAFQQQLDANERAVKRNGELRRRLGDEVFEEALRLRDWLDAQPQRTDVLRVLLGDKP